MRSFFLLLVFIVLNVGAAEEVTVHLTSWHSIDKEHDQWNPYNYGLSYKTEDGFKVGAFYNSSYTTTVYIGYEQNIGDDYGYLIAAGTGYDLPVGIALWYRWKNLRIDLLPISTVEHHYGVATGFSLVF